MKKIKKLVDVKHLLPLIVVLVAVGVMVFFLYVGISKNTAKAGDIVTVDYTLTLEDGTVYDTSIEDVGLEAGLERESYEPFVFELGAGEVIPGFDETVESMKIGESKEVTILPEDGYGKVRPELIIEDVKREIKVERFSSFNVSDVEAILERVPSVGEIVEIFDLPWDVRVANIIEGNITFESVLDATDVVSLPGVGWETRVVEENDEFIFLKQYPLEGDMVVVPSFDGVKQGKVFNVDDEEFNLDFNHPLAGKTLLFNVKLISVGKK